MAGFLKRAVAWIIDIIIISLAVTPFAIALFFFLIYETPEYSAYVYGYYPDYINSTAILLFEILTLELEQGILLIYFTLLEGGSKNATFGKRAMHIKVLNENFKPINKSKAFVRNFGRLGFIPLVSGVIGVIDIILILATNKQQRIGDRMARTVVVKETQYPMPYPSPYPPQYVPYQQPPSQPAPPYRSPPQEKEKKE